MSSHMLVDRLGFSEWEAAKLAQRNSEWYAKRCPARTVIETDGDRSALAELDKWTIGLYEPSRAGGIQQPAEKYRVEWTEEEPASATRQPNR